MATRRRWTGWLVALLAIALAGGAGWWAGRATVPPPAEEGQEAAQPVWAEVVNAAVGRTLPYPTTLRQPSLPVAYNGLSGVVTKASAGMKDVADELYRVGNVPVRPNRSGGTWRGTRRVMMSAPCRNCSSSSATTTANPPASSGPAPRPR